MPEYADLIGIPFVTGGRPDNQQKVGGLDCYGLAVEMSHRFHRTLPQAQSSEDHAVVAKMIEWTRDEWQRCEPHPGAAILFRVGGHLCHCGIQLNDFEFIHTWEMSGGVVVERLDDWEHRIEGYYRYVGHEQD